jgi:hypothetical protein
MTRPKLTRAELEALLRELPNYKEGEYPLIIVGIRGYYKNSMGKPGVNDRNIYDDALFILSPDTFKSFNANTDPSLYREGIAVLQAGIWPVYRFDFHRGKKTYPAICQRLGPVTVDRDNGKKNHSGWFGMNIHNGGWGSTGSLGCQTTPPDQWLDFYDTAESCAIRLWGDRWNKEPVCYILLNQK